MIASAVVRFRLIAAACLLAVAAGCGEPPAHPAVGKTLGKLPVAPLADLAAPPPALAGRVTLLNFWGTWCPPCRRELPGLARLAAGLAGEPRFQLVAVSCAGGGGSGDPADLAAETAEFLIRQKLTVPAYVFSDPVAADLLATTLGLEALPATYLIGPDATVRRVWIGYRPRDEAEIAAAIVTALKDSPANGAARAVRRDGSGSFESALVRGQEVRSNAGPRAVHVGLKMPPQFPRGPQHGGWRREDGYQRSSP